MKVEIKWTVLKDVCRWRSKNECYFPGERYMREVKAVACKYSECPALQDWYTPGRML